LKSFLADIESLVGTPSKGPSTNIKETQHHKSNHNQSSLQLSSCETAISNRKKFHATEDVVECYVLTISWFHFKYVVSIRTPLPKYFQLQTKLKSYSLLMIIKAI